MDGASGTGKSSLVRAGLLPRLQDLDPNLRVAVTRPETTEPMEALCQTLFAEDALPELAESDFPDPNALARHFLNGGDVAPVRRALERAQAAPDGPVRPTRLVVLVDQCEALFTNKVPAEDQAAYGSVLEGLIASGQFQVVATLRGNAREAALAVPPFERLINAAPGLSLGPPAPDAFGEIVRGPTEAAGLAFERNGDGVGLDEVLLSEVARDPDALPLLQFALEQLYARAARRVVDAGDRLGDVPDGAPILTLTHADYKAIGGLSGAIGAQAEAALSKVSPAARKRLAPLVRELTVAGRGEAVLGRAPTEVAASNAESRALVEALIDARILLRNAPQTKDGEPKIDELRFTHERVLKAWDRAREAVEAAAQYLRVRGDLTRSEERWRDGGHPRDLLLPAGLRLAEAEEVLRDFGPELDRRYPQLRPYIQTSGRLARRRQRLSQAAAAIFAVVAVAAGWFGYQNQQNAQLAAVEAERAEENATRAEQNAARAKAEAGRAAANAAEADAQRQTAENNAAEAEAQREVAQNGLSSAIETIRTAGNFVVEQAQSEQISTEAAGKILQVLTENLWDFAEQFDILSFNAGAAANVTERFSGALHRLGRFHEAAETWKRVLSFQRSVISASDHHPLALSVFAVGLQEGSFYVGSIDGATSESAMLLEGIEVYRQIFMHPMLQEPERLIQLRSTDAPVEAGFIHGLTRTNFARQVAESPRTLLNLSLPDRVILIDEAILSLQIASSLAPSFERLHEYYTASSDSTLYSLLSLKLATLTSMYLIQEGAKVLEIRERMESGALSSGQKIISWNEQAIVRLHELATVSESNVAISYLNAALTDLLPDIRAIANWNFPPLNGRRRKPHEAEAFH